MKKYFFVMMNGANIARYRTLTSARNYLDRKGYPREGDVVEIYDTDGEQYRLFGDSAPLRYFNR